MAACAGPVVHPAPRALDPVASASRWRARRLDDAGLQGFAASRAMLQGRAFPPVTWDLETLAVVGLYFHPDLREARSRMAEAEAAEVTAAARPNPQISLSPDVILGAFSGPSPWTLAFALDAPIETAGKRGKRVRLARRATRVAALQLAESAWQMRSRLRLALLDLLMARRKADGVRAELAARDRARAFLRRRFQVGEASRLDVQHTEIEITRAQAAAARVGLRVAEANAALAAALGLPAVALEGVSLAWPKLDTPPPPEALPIQAVQRAGVLHRLDVRRALADYAVTEAALQLEVAKQVPDFHTSPGYAFDQGDNRFGLGSSVTLPIFDRNRGPIREAVARRQAAQIRFEATQARAIAETERTRAAYVAAHSELHAAEGLVAQLAERERAAARSVALGEGNGLALVRVRIERLAGENGRLDALERTQKALGALEDAVQRPLVAPATTASAKASHVVVAGGGVR